MTRSLSSFPILTDTLRERIRLILLCDYTFSYTENGEEHRLTCDEITESSDVHKIYDHFGRWNPDDFDLEIHRTIRLQNISFLFGPNGIACSNAVIGVAVVWKSSDSKQRGAIPIGEIRDGDQSAELELNYEFHRAQLRGRVDFTTIFYLYQIGTPHSNEKHLANTYGCILGEIDRYIILLDGIGSEFPIYEEEEPGQPLWHVYCRWDDPTMDQFSECVEIIINTAHPNYYRLVPTNKNYDPQLMIEVIAGALSIIVMKLKEDKVYWPDTLQGKSLLKGSVSQAIYYFVSTLGWDVSSPEKLAISIRAYMEPRMLS